LKQVFCPGELWYSPVLHGTQSELPELGCTWPMGQTRHSVEPVTFCAVPGEHCVHCA
jgi:hypothetical protein